MKHSRHLIGGLARCVQAASLAFFWYLLLDAAWPLAEEWLPPDSFLRMDPLAALLAPLASRNWSTALAPGLAILALTLVAGRFFCGWLCPFGVTLTLARRLLWGPASPKKPNGSGGNGRNLKFFTLALMASAAAMGVNDFFWGSPIPLITRFYALLVHPLLLMLSKIALALGHTLIVALDMQTLQYLDVPARRFDSLYFLLAFFCLLFWLEKHQPRFWCRNLCPAGALLALFTLHPLFRRRVSGCAECGRCARFCPMEAIDPRGMGTRHGECIVCCSCADVCPAGAVTFGPGTSTPPESSEIAGHLPALPSRRSFLGATGLGALLAGVQYSGAHSLLNADNRRVSPTYVRPPGAVPEPEFLALCLRCGECMKTCPSNALQPVWLTAGPEGIFSPVITPRCGPCEPDCHACGRVCPTQAIRALPLEEKRWARVGTAVVLQNICLAWAQGRACVVCQEVCPYGAVNLKKMEGRAAPVVNNTRCYGCGYCERHCPALMPAIVVEPLNALRMKKGSYRQAAEAVGMDYTPFDAAGGEDAQTQTLPEDALDSLPPGFSQ